MAYLWCTEERIQTYLDQASVIIIGDGSGDTYATADAQRLENDVVYDIQHYLSIVFSSLPATTPGLLISAAAKLTAAAIGQARMGSSMGNELTPWTQRLSNSAWTTLQRIFISQKLAGATKISIPLWERVIQSRVRERSVVPNV